MKLKELIKVLDQEIKDRRLIDFDVKGISCNSKEAQENFIFVAIKGTHDDGHRYIREAIEKHARAVVSEESYSQLHISSDVSVIMVNDARRALAKLAAAFYGNPSTKLKIVGVTGTNGKTTITYLLEALLREYTRQPAVIGTVNYRFKDKVIPSKNTTPGPLELQPLFSNMLKEGIEYAIMEVSSHALDQERVEGIHFHSAIFTNLTQDHLDYHQTLENYFSAKAKLFKDLSPRAFAVLNIDDDYGRRLKELTRARRISYGIDKKADCMACDIRCGLTHSEFILKYDKQEIPMTTSLIGRHNVYNILSTAAWAIGEEIPAAVIQSAISKFHVVPGRLEKIECARDFLVFVDYAHTEDALKNVISALRPLTQKKIIVVFGCGGERDKTKRPKMGNVVTQASDFAIITSDNPRSEDPQEIINEIRQGVKKENYCVIPERRDAIKKALSLAERGDIVLVAGKGHETYQILKEGTIHFDDREVVRECLKSMN